MKKYKKIGVYLLAICLIFALTACNDSEADEFTSLRSFEYHFIPEEYEEEYSEYEKTITLEADTDYQFKVDATCESGTIESVLPMRTRKKQCISSIPLLHVMIK